MILIDKFSIAVRLSSIGYVLTLLDGSFISVTRDSEQTVVKN